MSSPSFSAHDDHAHSPQYANKSTARLSFVLPPLSAVKAQKSKKKIKLTVSEPVKQQKQPRPIKLKPLKEVLTRLIAQIKKKDDYAFFLNPVDPAQVPGYSDAISRPMDLGTMTVKVEKGKYRSLEEFASDLKLVTTNAKTFNPPGTIYYTEAERIEAYALDHITKAAATVIEYETDWNIDVEKDDELVADDEDGPGNLAPGTPMDVDESRAGSPSVMSGQIGGKRGKGKKVPGTLTESLEADGGLPGAKDGLGAFPPGSDWAELMLALKLKGKRYRTKKERMRMEKGGPPIAADGSLDYPEMEDPFSVLSAMVPDPPSRPLLCPLYATLDPPDPSQPPFPAPVNILAGHEVPDPSVTSAPVASGSKLKNIKPKKRRHWIINKNAPSRYRAKDLGEEEAVPAWKTPREPVATDFGTFATLPSALAEERNARDFTTELGSEERMFGVLRDTLQPRYTSQPDATVETDEDSYWRGRAGEAEAYIRDVVYGGVEGYAYVRSVAEFLTPSEPARRNGEPPTYGALGMPVAQWIERNVIDPLTDGRHGILRDAVRILNVLPPTPPPSAPSTSPASLQLPLPPALSLPASSVTPLMSRAAIRRQVELCLHAYPVASRALATLNAIRAAKIDLGALIRAPEELFHAEDVWAGREYRDKKKREMEEALARDPEKNAAAYLQWAIAEHREAEASAVLASGAGSGTAGTTAEDAGMLEYALQVAADEIARLAKEGVGVGVGGKLEDGDRGVVDGSNEAAQVRPVAKTEDASEPKVTDTDGDVMMKTEEEEEESVDGSSSPPPHTSPAASGSNTAGDGATASTASTGKSEEEDPVMKKLRLNLLALAKRAPLDQIMKLPPELVPAHLRHIVPTVDK